MTPRTLVLAASPLALMLAAPALAQQSLVNTFHYQLTVETVAEGIEHPWAIALLPDGRYLVTERNSGQLRVGTPDGALSAPLEGMPEVFRFPEDTDNSQAGLFDVKLDPDFEENGFIYFSYSRPTDRGTGVSVDRAELVDTGDVLELASVETIFTMDPESQDSGGLHFGGRMAIHPEDGTLYLMVGDRRNMSRAQDGEDQAGALLRMTLSGEVPDDNPFLEDAEVNDYIYTMGHRNSQGLGFDPETHELWANEHGPLGGDMIHLIEAGNNYGWPFLTGGVDYSGAPMGVGTEMEGMTSAVHIFEETIAPSGLVFVTGEGFPLWEGDMLHGGLYSEGLVRTRVEDGTVTEIEEIEIGRRIRDVAIGADGAIWVVTEHEDGEVLRLTPGDQ